MGYFGRSIARYEGNFADFTGGIDDVEELDELRGGHAGTDFDTDRVSDSTEELHVGAVELAGTVSDPDEVSGCSIVAIGGRDG